MPLIFHKAASLFVHPPTATDRIEVMSLLSMRPTRRRPYLGLNLGWLNVTVQAVENIDDLFIVTPRWIDQRKQVNGSSEKLVR